MAGLVRDTSGAPVAGATVNVVSPSQTASTTTDAQGHFIILSLAPDTYTVNVTKTGYQPTSFPGEVVFADQTQQTTYTIGKALKTIAHVTAAGAGNLVKSGVGGDLYNVNAAQAAAASALGGGGNLNNAYSALATVPGLQVNQGGLGWTYNASYVRGQNQYYTGYEYDGIPVNRAFDNYNSSTESSLGLQELQVYTGGGPASVASAGTAGFINQVIKTGTFPGYATANVGIGAPQYYHQAQVEVGGATPDRNFSYYVGLSGYNQTFRFGTQEMAANYNAPNGYYSGPAAIGTTIGYTASPTFTGQGVKTSCPLGEAPPSTTPPQGCWAYYNGWAAGPSLITDRESIVNVHFGIPKHNGLRDDVQAMWSGSALNNGEYGSLTDIANTPNQFFYSWFTHSAYGTPTCNVPVTVAPWANLTVNGCEGNLAGVGVSTCNGTTGPLGKKITGITGCYLPYADQVVYNVPFGTPIASSATNFTQPSIYYAPSTPSHLFGQNIDPYTEYGTYMNDTGITKLQYTYALSSSAYLRAYGYTLYSDWLQNGPVYGASGQAVPSLPSAQYDLMTHTVGAALDFNDQVDDQNLVNGSYNYTQAGVIRFNNSSAIAGAGTTPIGYMANGRCYDPASGAQVPCLSSTAYDTATIVVSGKTIDCAKVVNAACYYHHPWTSNAASGPTGFAAAGTAAAAAGATWDSLWNGEATGSLNTVKPRFQNGAVGDQWRPNDKFLVNASIRYDNFTYNLPDSAGPADAFYANMTSNYTCVQASNNQVLTQPLPPGVPPPAAAQYVIGDCNAAASVLSPTGPHTGWVHPNGTTQDGVKAPSFTASSPASYSIGYWQPRFSATYTESPDTVWRVSAGEYTQPPLSASVQYLSASGDDRSVWNNTMNLGFYSPFHPIPGIQSDQYDLSYERHMTGTDMSMKITPFYTWVNGWQQQTFIGSGFVTQVPVGVNRDYGLEFQFTKGDFSRNGFSGLFSFTYTNSKVRFSNEGLSNGGIIPNTTIALNQVIAQYNALTKSGGGSQCYEATAPAPCNAKPICATATGAPVACGTAGSHIAFTPVSNPYYNQPSQGQMDPNGWYDPYSTAIAPNLNGSVTSYISPAVASLILNYRQDKWAVTPSVQWQAGGFYGSPLDVNGYDPRACALNSATTGITKLSPGTPGLQCNVNTLIAPGFGPQGYFYIPNPQTGHFSAIGSYENPSLMTGNLQVSYDVSPKIKVTFTGSNLFRYCFGGTPTPWSAVYGPSPSVCSYGAAGGVLNSSLYPANFYNGKGIGDTKANGGVATPWTQSYTPGTNNVGAIGGNWIPYNFFVNAQIKI
ncbi:MAG: TonB-dependent receptor [Candidatus Eremiobacteraeota bacterium]|nr:TonB-dependent receptor [Candidatus Eremiobacteraeota bacterium]